jgi:phosphoadenosine phosphosulfate reductase
MPLIEHTLFGDIDKVQVAIDRIKQFEPPEGYYMAFSGGKDSETVYRLTEMAGVKFDAHFNLTSVDPPEVVRFVREFYPDVQRHPPLSDKDATAVRN